MTVTQPNLTRRAVDPRALYLTSFTVVGLSLGMLGPALTQLRDRSGTDIGGVGVLFAGQACGYIVGSFGSGRILDRVDGHRLYAAALVVLGAGMFAVPLFSSIYVLTAVFAVIGAGAASVDIGANTMLMWSRGAEVGRSMNLLHLCFGLGALSAPLFVHVSLDGTLRIAALICVVLAIWALTIEAPRVAAAPRDEHATATRSILGLAGLFFVVYVGMEIGFAGWVFTYGEEIDFTDTAATWLTTLFWVSFTLGRIMSTVLVNSVRPKWLLFVTTSASIAAALVLVVGDSRSGAVWFGTTMMGFALAPQFPMMLTYLERRIAITGSATSWFLGGAGVGILVPPWLIGLWLDRSGPSAFPLAMVLLGTITLAVFAMSNRALGG